MQGQTPAIGCYFSLLSFYRLSSIRNQINNWHCDHGTVVRIVGQVVFLQELMRGMIDAPP